MLHLVLPMLAQHLLAACAAAPAFATAFENLIQHTAAIPADGGCE